MCLPKLVRRKYWKLCDPRPLLNESLGSGLKMEEVTKVSGGCRVTKGLSAALFKVAVNSEKACTGQPTETGAASVMVCRVFLALCAPQPMEAGAGMLYF